MITGTLTQAKDPYDNWTICNRCNEEYDMTQHDECPDCNED